MPRKIKHQVKDAGVILTPAHRDSPSITDYAARRVKSISKSPDLTRKIPVSIPDMRAVIFINRGEDPDEAIAYYKGTLRNAMNTSKKNNGEFVTVIAED
jgi:hypothetical protein